jgi:putative CocE/NonD family hydrolase
VTRFSLVAVALGLGAVVAAWAYVERASLLEAMPRPIRDAVREFRHGYSIERDLMVPVGGGVHLATDVYRPRHAADRVGTVLVRLPYDKNDYREALDAGEAFASRGFAVVVQDMRGKGGSEGEFIPSKFDREDGSATIDWIVRQPWSNGKVGTYGCSALGESQIMLASARNPAHVAMIAQGAGGAIGSAGGRYTYFGLYEGGVFNLASGFGWFLSSGSKLKGYPEPPGVDKSAALLELPTLGMVRRHRSDPTDFDDFLAKPLGDPFWRSLGYIADEDRFATPALNVNSWQDQTVADTLVLSDLMKRNAESESARVNHHVIIAPGNHCAFHWTADAGRVGDQPVSEAARAPFWDWYTAWFRHWLGDGSEPLPKLPPYLLYVMAEDRWLEADAWPVPEADEVRWYLGERSLARSASGAAGYDEYRYDPADPVPTKGGPICCTGNAADRSGPVDQREIESRPDVLTYTTPPLQQGVRVVGPLNARLFVSSSARDTDFVAKLVDVWPDGTALNVQEGALRMRYRDSYVQPTLMEPGTVYEVTLDMRAIAHLFKPGHRIQLQLSSSSFPRLERNLNTGGNNYDETQGVVATNRIHRGGDTASYLSVRVLPDSAVRWRE